MKIKSVMAVIVLALISISLYSCSDSVVNTINDIVNNKVTAKDRLDSAYAQAQRKYSPSTQLVMVFGKNVLYDGTDAGKTDISITTGLSDPNNLGAWLYIFKKPGTDTLAVYTPNPVPGARDCIELTSLFSTNTIVNLVADTSARSIVSGALSMITQSNFHISTSKDSLVNSDVAYGYSYSSNPIIRFNSSWIPSSSTFNGNAFLGQTGTNKSVNMFLIPGLGTLNLPAYITNLTGFPQDLWIVNYKLDNAGVTQNFIAGTVVKSNQNMGISFLGLLSKAINISKY
jgi:hypothetical protein